MTALWIVLFLAALWVFGNGVGYLFTRATRPDDVPWPVNWRILAGPIVYVNWAFDRAYN